MKLRYAIFALFFCVSTFFPVIAADPVSFVSLTTLSIGRSDLDDIGDLNFNPKVGIQTYGGTKFVSLKLNTYSSTVIRIASDLLAKSLEQVAITGLPLVYPNPSHWPQGATLGYNLNKDADIDIHIFDMTGTQVAIANRTATNEGGKSGYNRLRIDPSTLYGYELSSGVYFYFISHQGRLLGKGKMAVVP